MQATLITRSQLIELVETVWSSMLGLPVYDTADDAHAIGSARLTACVPISGHWNGTVLLQLTERFARRAAGLLLVEPGDQLPLEDIHDTAAELCNILGGGIKSLLPGPSSLSLPSVVNGTDYLVRVPRARLVAQVEVLCESQPIGIRLLEATIGPLDPFNPAPR